MLTLERRKEILEYMKSKNAVTVSDLSSHFFISEATIRRDLEKMSKQGLIKRTYGGAVLLDGLNSDLPLMLREGESTKFKDQIAAAAAPFIQNGSTVFLDSSSTVSRLVPYFAGLSGVTVVTNAPKTAALLCEYRNLEVYCAGGKLRGNSCSVVGSTAYSFFAGCYADIAFISCRGICVDKGITDTSLEDAEIKRQMLQTARTKVLLCDSSKFGKEFFSLVCTVSSLDYVITNRGCDNNMINAISAAGPTVISG
jgi:DeoR/GlpR family transcriptional regulator of sugar metabolism